MKWASDTTPPEAQDVKPFLAHLEDLRQTLIRCLVALAVGMGVAVPLMPRAMTWLKAPLRAVTDHPDQFLRSLDVSGAFSVSLNMALWTGLLFSAPFLLLFLGAFVFPGLTQQEQKVVLHAGGFAVALFALGVWFGYQFTLPAALTMMFGMHTWLGIRPEWTVTSYVTFALQLLIGFGLVFELPAILLVLGKLGIVRSLQLRSLRRHAIVVILIVAAALTPPDVFSQLLMAVPLIGLYELCIWLVWLDERKKEKGDATPPGRARWP
jgi:sec-independent protein translocase protein TatC